MVKSAARGKESLKKKDNGTKACYGLTLVDFRFESYEHTGATALKSQNSNVFLLMSFPFLRLTLESHSKSLPDCRQAIEPSLGREIP